MLDERAWLVLVPPRGVGWGFMLACQVLPNQTQPSMALWSWLCALGLSHVGTEKDFPQSVPCNHHWTPENKPLQHYSSSIKRYSQHSAGSQVTPDYQIESSDGITALHLMPGIVLGDTWLCQSCHAAPGALFWADVARGVLEHCGY